MTLRRTVRMTLRTAAARAVSAAARGVRSPAAALLAAGELRGAASWAQRLLPAVSWLRRRSTPSLAALTVRQKVDRHWQTVQWCFATPDEFARYLRHGQLHEVDAGGRVVRSVVRAEDLREGATYVFRAADTTDVAGAVKNLAAGHERESTAALARDARITAALGPLRLFNGGEPFTFFGSDGEALLQVDGLLLCEQHPLLLLNEAKLSPLEMHVTEVRMRCSSLETMLRSAGGVTNWPRELEGYRNARVLPCLSGVCFAPAVQASALAEGVVPVVCSGARFHVHPQAAPLLQPANVILPR